MVLLYIHIIYIILCFIYVWYGYFIFLLSKLHRQSDQYEKITLADDCQDKLINAELFLYNLHFNIIFNYYYQVVN